MKKKVVILGSTGSIGTNALNVLSRLSDGFEVIGLSAGSNTELLAAQARKFKSEVVCIGTEELAARLRRLVPGATKVLWGTEGLREIIATSGADILVIAIAGCAAIAPLVEAVKKNRRIALANKEALISAGPVVMAMAEKSGAQIIPVDSEHSAIFQCLDGRRGNISKIYLTASGGPLLNISAEKFDSIARRSILKHPRWKMGEKITIDSATLMNKGLEIIEAQYLFDVDEEKIEVLIHPEAVIHSMVEFVDGVIMAQLSIPDMRIPIQYALTYPSRQKGFLKSVDFSGISSFSFRAPDTKKFPCLELAREAARSGGTLPSVLCAADEEAVRSYLSGDIKFSAIPKVIGKVLSRHRNSKRKEPSLRDILDAGEWAKEEARSICYH